jgi:hypothetical protein
MFMFEHINDVTHSLRTLGEGVLSSVLDGQKRSVFELLDRAQIRCSDAEGDTTSDSTGGGVGSKSASAGPATATISAVSSFLSAALSANASLPSALNSGIGASAEEDAVYNDWTASQLVVSHLDKLKGQWGVSNFYVFYMHVKQLKGLIMSIKNVNALLQSVLQETVYVK